MVQNYGRKKLLDCRVPTFLMTQTTLPSWLQTNIAFAYIYVLWILVKKACQQGYENKNSLQVTAFSICLSTSILSLYHIKFHTYIWQFVKTGTFVWHMALVPQREELRFVSTTSMVQCAMTSGTNWMLEWSAEHLDIQEEVPQIINYIFISEWDTYYLHCLLAKMFKVRLILPEQPPNICD